MTDADVTQELTSPLGDAHSGDGSGAPPGYPRPFGQYLLLAPLAHGGMGEVFLAANRNEAGAVRLVVIKTLRPDLAKEAGYVNRFLDEARIVVQLSHANICQVFDVGRQDGAYFFAMEHIAGINLRTLIDALQHSQRKLPRGLALFIVADVLEGLAAAHRHRHPLTGQLLNVVHRDVSPHNVMLSFEGDIKLIDFGLAESDLKREHTESQVVMGKIAYMSPEQARGEPVDASSDQYSAGILLYELLVGERYYGDMTQREIWGTAGARGYVPPRWGDLHDDIARVLERALAHDRKQRFATCHDFAEELRVILRTRYSTIDRTSLRNFVREAVRDELEASERSLRNLGGLAMTAMPASDEERAIRTSDIPLPPDTSVDAGTGSTRTWMVFGKRRREGWPVAALAAFAGLALGAVGVILVLPRLIEPPTAPVVVERVEVPVEVPVPVPVLVADAGVHESAAVDAGERTERVERAAPKRPKRVVERAERPVKRPWTSWTEAKKLEAIAGCEKVCAKSIRAIKKKGEAVQAIVLDDCVETCTKR